MTAALAAALTLSPGELIAERLYELLRANKMGSTTFLLHARSLELNHELGWFYLRWLITRARARSPLILNEGVGRFEISADS